jgi:hypothetical protein
MMYFLTPGFWFGTGASRFLLAVAGWAVRMAKAANRAAKTGARIVAALILQDSLRKARSKQAGEKALHG